MLQKTIALSNVFFYERLATMTRQRRKRIKKAYKVGNRRN
jgi:hypothetical protein